MAWPNPNKLLVEGDEDQRVIPQLIEANGIPWGESRAEWIVEIKAVGGIERLLEPGSISAQLKERDLQRLGILVDADSDAQACWQRIRAQCIGPYPSLPVELDPAGIVAESQDGQRLGVWLMSDNRSCGMLETFLAYLVPTGAEKLWTHASGCRRRQVPQQQSKSRVPPPVLPGLSTFHAVYWLDSGSNQSPGDRPRMSPYASDGARLFSEGSVLLAMLLAFGVGRLIRALLIAADRWRWQWRRREQAGSDAGERGEDLHPYELGLVNGDADGAIATCVCSLAQRGLVEIDPQGQLVRTARQPELALAPDGIFRGVVTATKLPGLERAVLSGLSHVRATPYSQLRRMSWVREEAENLAGRPEARGLVRSRPSYHLHALAVSAPYDVIMVMTALSLWRTGPIVALLYLAIAVLIRARARQSAWLAPVPRCTRRGQAALAHLAEQHAWLIDKARIAPETLADDELALVCAIQGEANLRGSLAALSAMFIAGNARVSLHQRTIKPSLLD